MLSKEMKIVNVGFMNTGTNKVHQSNTVYSSFGICPCLCSYANRYGGIQTNILVVENDKKTNNSNN